MKRRVAIMASVLILAGCSKVDPPQTAPATSVAASTPPPAPASAPPPAATSGTPTATPDGKHVFDGFSLGSDFGAVMARAPYDEPCDNDAIDNSARRMMLYGSKPCRDHVFPDKTSVIFLLAFADGETKYAQPIQALVWMGGAYFEKRSNFPARTGTTLAEAERALGAAGPKFIVVEDGNLGRHGRRTNEGVTLTIRKHPADVYSIADGDHVIGFAVGPMPDDPENEQWRMVAQIYRRYTREGA